MIVSRFIVSVGKQETDSSEFSNKSQFLHSKNFHLNHIINVMSHTHSIRNKMEGQSCMMAHACDPSTQYLRHDFHKLEGRMSCAVPKSIFKT